MVDTAVVERFCVPGPGGIRVELSDEVGATLPSEKILLDDNLDRFRSCRRGRMSPCSTSAS